MLTFFRSALLSRLSSSPSPRRVRFVSRAAGADSFPFPFDSCAGRAGAGLVPVAFAPAAALGLVLDDVLGLSALPVGLESPLDPDFWPLKDASGETRGRFLSAA
jgi:hypothetical protein